MAPTLVYLRGIGTADTATGWRTALDAALARQDGAPRLATLATVAPSYADLLTGPEPRDVSAPPLTHRPLTGDDLRVAEGCYFRRLAWLARELHDEPLVSPAPPPRVPEVLVDEIMGRWFAAADCYRKHPSARRTVLERVLAQVPRGGEIVLVGHSLGSVIALDLLYYLPRSVDVRLLLTLGSPLSLPALQCHLERVHASFPFDRVGGWLNIVGRWDYVTGGRGTAGSFPEALDVFVDTGSAWQDPHAAVCYLDQDAVATAVRLAVADESRNLAAPGRLPESPLRDHLLGVLARMQFALRLEQALPHGERRTRFRSARLLLADDIAATIAVTIAATVGTSGPGGQPAHPSLGNLAADHVDLLRGRWHPRVGLALAVALVAGNPIAPYEVNVDDDTRVRALAMLLGDLDLPHSWTGVVADAFRQARESHRNGKPWRWALLAVGALAVAAAPFAVLAAAPAGLAGAASITAGLAGLGPGGMLGGLGVVGAIGGAGGITAAAALQGGSPAAVAESVVALQTLAVARQRLQLQEPGRPEWQLLVTTEAHLAAEHHRHERISDKGADHLGATEHKLKTVRAALEWMRKRDLGPPQLSPRRATPGGNRRAEAREHDVRRVTHVGDSVGDRLAAAVNGR